MKKFKVMFIALLSVALLASCTKQTKQPDQGSSSSQAAKTEKLQVVTTNSILADLAMTVGGDAVDVYSIVPVGTDPHEYEPLPEDIAKSTEADLIFYNGLNLETGGNGWFAKLMETSHKTEGEDYVAVSEGVKPMYLTSAGQESEADPHAWLDIANGMIYIDNITKALSKKDPAHQADFEANAKTYKEKLTELDQKAKGEFASLPKDQALLVTSEGAFKYFSKAYGLEAAYIWEINTESQGTPEQMSKIIDKIRSTKVPAVFVETSVDPRSMEAVAKETGLPIYTKIFTDSLAKKGEAGDTYYTMMEWNLTKIHEGLQRKK